VSENACVMLLILPFAAGDDNMRKFLPIFGVVVTALCFVGIIILLYDRIDQFRTLGLNEVGDFLAGVFGLLTILWLILGFFQQSKELQQSSEALKPKQKS